MDDILFVEVPDPLADSLHKNLGIGLCVPAERVTRRQPPTPVGTVLGSLFTSDDAVK